MQDYSGEFNPDFRVEELPGPFLAKLLKVYSGLYYSLDGFWYVAVMNRFGDDAAFELDLWAWKKQTKRELDQLTKLFKIEGKDVATVMKAFQVKPWWLGLEHNIELKDNKHAVLTVTGCSLLTALEKEGRGRESRICRGAEATILKYIAEYFNPAIEVTGLQVPPRERKDGICCQWEFKLD